MAKQRCLILTLSLLVILFLQSCTGMMASQRRERYVDEHPWINEETREAILAGEIMIGMLRSQVIASWGHPDDINRSIGSWGRHEQWVYGQTTAVYLYFEDGILTSWQD